MNMVKVKGMQTVLRNLKKHNVSMGVKLERGLIDGGKLLLRESLLIVPRQTSDLAGSSFIRSFLTGFETDVVVGFTANYAAFVHEDMDAAHGAAFNVKYADKIAGRAARGRKRRKLGKKHDVITDPYFKRGEKQQAKFLETPMRTKRKEILSAIVSELLK